MSVNKVILVGNVGKDPEVKQFQNGNRIASFSLATSENWKDKQSGERKERTEWHNVTINSDGLVSVAERFIRKGSKLYIEGKLQTRKWQDQSGNDRYTTEVVVSGFGGSLVMLDGKSEGQGDYDPSAPRGSQKPEPDQGYDYAFDDEIPFNYGR